MIIELFPSTLFLIKVKNHKKIKDKCLEYIIPEYEAEPSTFVDSWDADVFTTFGKNINFPWNDILPLYSSELKTFSEELNIVGNPMITDAWFNAYNENQGQEMHEHLPSHFSAIHYLSYDKEVHTPTVFCSPFRQSALSNAPVFSKDIDEVPGTWVSLQYVKVDEGDLLIFPSFLEHKVPRQSSNKIRATMSFNLNFVQ